MTKSEKIYNLEERTAKFGEDIILFCKSVRQDNINKSILNQLIRSGASVGANYCETDGAESGKDFKHKIAICKKEAKETKHWLRMITKTNSEKTKECRILWQEVQELTLIFSAILLSKNKKKEKFDI